MYQVSIVPCNSYKNKEVRKALESSLKNIDFKFKKGMRVLIKPNILRPAAPEQAITTHPAVIEELCKMLKKYDAEIYIGESSGENTDEGFKVSGIGKLKKYAKIINFEASSKSFHDFPTLKRVPLPAILQEADLIINVAKLKTHAFTGVTLCVKNHYGFIPGKIKSYYHKMLPSSKTFSKFLLELHGKIKPQLNIIDGVLGLEGLGPGAPGKPIKSKVIIAGRDAIATDIIASELMGFAPYSIYTNKFSGIKRGEIEIIGKEIKLNFEKPVSFAIFVSPMIHSLSRLFPKPKIIFDHKKCSKCHLCEKKCPVKAIKLQPFPEWNNKKCIRCLCCVELCPNGAVSLKEHWTRESAKKIYKRLKQVF